MKKTPEDIIKEYGYDMILSESQQNSIKQMMIEYAHIIFKDGCEKCQKDHPRRTRWGFGCNP